MEVESLPCIDTGDGHSGNVGSDPQMVASCHQPIISSISPCKGELKAEEVADVVAQTIQESVAAKASVERRVSARLQNRVKKSYDAPRKESPDHPRDKTSRKKGKVFHPREEELSNSGVVYEGCANPSVQLDSNEEADSVAVQCVNLLDRSFQDVQEDGLIGDCSSTNPVGKSAHARVKETLRLFNLHYLHFVQEEEKRCKKKEVNGVKISKDCKSKVKNGEMRDEENGRTKARRPDLKAITKMIETNAILYPGKRFGQLPGIDVGHQFFSRAEMVAVGFHGHWLNGIDYMGQSYSKLEEYRGYTFPLAVAIVMSGVYEDVDNSEEVVYTGQGGLNLLGDKRQIQDQVMSRGNLALKNNMEQCIPVRVIRGHGSASSYCGRVYTYDGLYKVVQYWAEKGDCGFTVFKYCLRRLEGQPVLTTHQVFARRQLKRSFAELPGLVHDDISTNQEEIHIPATNLIDNPPVAPEGFKYSKSIKVAESVMLPPDASGCNCRGTCTDPRTCACAKLNGEDFPYVHRDGGRLIEAKAVVFECGPRCGCGPGCINRTSQRGLKYRFEVFRAPNKGWAVRSWDPIPSGAPVCEYTGVLMRTDDLDNVSENDYIFEIDCLQTMKGLDGRERRLGDVSMPMNVHQDKTSDKTSESVPEFCIDAGSIGNIARFINHSCEPNLFVQCILSSHHDIKLARVMLFAADNIPPLQELTYDYGYALDSVIGPDGNIKVMTCHCGAMGCRKRLF